jgi:hypothetical protein
MDDLATQYRGRIRVGRFMVYSRFGEVLYPQIKDRLKITYMPTVILFDRGVEVSRWELVGLEDLYRIDIDKYLKARATRRFTAAPPAR